MPPKLAIMIAGTLLVAAASVGLIATANAPAPAPAARSDASPGTPDAPAASAATPPAAAPRARAGRVYDLEEAIKRLDLIKPARHKMAEDFTLPTPTSAT